MAKAVRWQIPFVSLTGIRYRIDIYDEGYTGTAVQLYGGTSPFTTDEDNTDDYFAPIRIQTGNIQVCTALPGGGMLSLDDILPENNIARPVRLVNLSASNKIEWQGFLSCEAYSQQYTAVPEILTLPVIGVLEAMASVELNLDRSSGFVHLYESAYYIIKEIETQCGLTCFTHVNYSATDFRIFFKYIDQTALFNRNEQDNENETSYVISGISCKDALERIAAFMGQVIREQGTELYFERIGEEIGMCRDTLYDFGNNFHLIQIVNSLVSADISAMTWRGADHQRTIRQGAKSVAVVLNLEKYGIDIAIPEFPVGNTQQMYGELKTNDWLYVLANANANAYSNIQVAYYSAQEKIDFYNFQSYATSNLTNLLSHMAAGPNSSIKASMNTIDWVRFYAGAFLSRSCWEDSGSVTAHDTQDGLYCVFFPRSVEYSVETTNFDPTQVGAIFSIDNMLNFRCTTGYIQLTADAETVFMSTGTLVHNDNTVSNRYITVELSIGNQWWNGSSWQGTQCFFKALFTNNNFKSNWDPSMEITETDGLLIPVTDVLYGNVTLKIWPMCSQTSNAPLYPLEMIFHTLEVNHILPVDANISKRGANRYYKLLGTNFKDEITVNTELGSGLNNELSPSVLMNSNSEMMSKLGYSIPGSANTESRRPEKDLLARLAAYYGAARQQLKLEVLHPTVAALPMIKLNGINDGKKYLPLAESRDWQADRSTITCFETVVNS